MKNQGLLIMVMILLGLLGGCNSAETQSGQGESFSGFLSRFPKLTTPCKLGEGQKIGFSINFEKEKENDLIALYPEILRQIPSFSDTSYYFNVFPIGQIDENDGFRTVLVEQLQWDVPALGSGIYLITFSPTGKYISGEHIADYVGDENLIVEFVNGTSLKVTGLAIEMPDLFSEQEEIQKQDTIPFVEHYSIGEGGTITRKN